MEFKMSRTYRRKNCEWDFNAYLDKSKDLKKQKSKYHSDAYFTYAIPNWYINKFHTRPDRYKARKSIKTWMTHPDEYEVQSDKWFKCAGYRYW